MPTKVEVSLTLGNVSTALGNVSIMTVTAEHEYLIELVRHRPSLVTSLLTEMGYAVPSFDEAELGNTDFTECRPTEYRADSVVILAKDGTPAWAVVLEVQREFDPDKQWSWPVYLSTLRARHKCPVLLLVFCQKAATARRCAKAIDMGHPEWVLLPIVLGPENVPAITDVTRAIAEPELMALSTIVHGNLQSEVTAKVLATFVEAYFQGSKNRKDYTGLVLMLLPRSVATKLYEELTVNVRVEDLQHLPFALEWVELGEARGEARGEAKGEAKAILRFLSSRGVHVSHEAQERILTCTDQETLETWIDRATTATNVDELFA
ncbi:hypothetical protein [Nonomuraea insulae]|uniref:DUF4351 domain-containing protein n=1 Tax=Nonomuraea insulae TaxID=1616787 RepID=A0ABW1CLU7_9ACTN